MVVGFHGSVWKKSIFCRWKISWLSATVVCGLLQYGAWLSRVAAAAAAWESPWSELQIFRSLIFVFLATLKLTLIVRFFSPSWPAGVPPILSVWFWSVGRVVGRLGWKLLLLSGSELGAWFIHVQLQPNNCPATKTRSVMLLLWEWRISHSQMILIFPFFQVADLSYWNSIDNSRRITRKQEKLRACSLNILFTSSWANAVSSFASWHLRQKEEEEGTLKTAWQHSTRLPLVKNGDITQLPELVKILEEEEEKMAVRETKTGLETGVAGLTISPQVKKSILCSSLLT